MFDFSGIKPSYDVLVWASEDTNMFWMEFSTSAELKISVQKDLREKAFGVIGMPCDEILWIQSPVGMDRRQVMERICTTLELEVFKIERKLIPEHKTSSEVAPIQSFIIG
jgi:hypothetical protein